ncbi:HAD family hydrolase [Caproiciproducens sp. MSJ-32]|uniref:HAD family hydrolase n=1 Tax=Caproiciproducens sp. MSJ-32 TaxID=2841527 RepID=UPI001C109665|nr:HAD family hydrolase [Caproiciproducens sp. MSJ-32]MBU5455891.1 HAD family hydrolase [Caproiciproducens sp. MSJ-32]
MKKGIIFDLDGTLWDSCPQITEGWNKAIEECEDIDFKLTIEDVRSVMGKTPKEIAVTLFNKVTEERAMEIMKKCFEEEEKIIREKGGVLFPKLIENLEELKKDYELFIVSNCQDGYIQDFLDFYKLRSYFKDYENAGRTKLNKDKNIELVVKRNNLDKALYLGDTEGDYKAAKLAGVPFVHAKYGFGTVRDAEYSINSFEELKDIARKILN